MQREGTRSFNTRRKGASLLLSECFARFSNRLGYPIFSVEAAGASTSSLTRLRAGGAIASAVGAQCFSESVQIGCITAFFLPDAPPTTPRFFTAIGLPLKLPSSGCPNPMVVAAASADVASGGPKPMVVIPSEGAAAASRGGASSACSRTFARTSASSSSTSVCSSLAALLPLPLVSASSFSCSTAAADSYASRACLRWTASIFAISSGVGAAVSFSASFAAWRTFSILATAAVPIW
mmetsp:Transcript_36060/g.82606  ORF Transcript_36060/g.82606 Transcript_36060/m.82606 type:complete len:237 (+) Transcript_36060:312-1022(+)